MIGQKCKKKSSQIPISKNQAFPFIIIIVFLILAPLYTEWFDIDEPCHYGDYEDVRQNFAYVGNFEKSGKLFQRSTMSIDN